MRLKYLKCVIPAEVAQRYSDWTECKAFRVARVDGQVVLEATNDLELLTRPEES